ncbi:hypothetical protein L1887_39220 [Cichorium endivia]|nr:hypothetical protein L1887_39220 [Cichorium endivia]
MNGRRQKFFNAGFSAIPFIAGEDEEVGGTIGWGWAAPITTVFLTDHIPVSTASPSDTSDETTGSTGSPANWSRQKNIVTLFCVAAVVVDGGVEEMCGEMIEEKASDLDSGYWFLKADPTVENGGDSAMEFEP